MKQHSKEIILLALGVLALVVVSCVITSSASAIVPKYAAGDIVYTGSGDRFMRISNNVAVVTGITEDCFMHDCRPIYYRFERARLVPYPSEWNAPGGYVYADPVFSMEIQAFEERYPIIIQHSDLILEHSFRVRPGILPW